VIGGVHDNKVLAAAATGGSPTRVPLVRELGAMVGGSGGGTPELASPVGATRRGLDDALEAARQALRST